MMLALVNSEKCSRCIQTHTPITVGSRSKDSVADECLMNPDVAMLEDWLFILIFPSI